MKTSSMTIVDKYIKEHTGQQWFHILRLPFMFFAVFELLLLGIIQFNFDSKLHWVLDTKASYETWKCAILVGSIGALIGLSLRGVNYLSKYHVTSTAQLINSLAWGCAGFIMLDAADEPALALGLFLLSMVNVALAIIDEGWGDRKITQRKD